MCDFYSANASDLKNHARNLLLNFNPPILNAQNGYAELPFNEEQKEEDNFFDHLAAAIANERQVDKEEHQRQAHSE